VNSEQNRRLVLDLWKAFAERDFQTVSDLFDDDIEWIAPEGNATAVFSKGPSHLIGKEMVMQFLTSGFRKVFQDEVRFEIRNIYADGNAVIVEQPFQARVANGNFYKNDYCFIIELKDGRVRQVREYMDTQRARDAIMGLP
jgi:ketosteroid isomerase-like protein